MAPPALGPEAEREGALGTPMASIKRRYSAAVKWVELDKTDESELSHNVPVRAISEISAAMRGLLHRSMELEDLDTVCWFSERLM
jgi:hypothetical protein